MAKVDIVGIKNPLFSLLGTRLHPDFNIMQRNARDGKIERERAGILRLAVILEQLGSSLDIQHTRAVRCDVDQCPAPLGMPKRQQLPAPADKAQRTHGVIHMD